jgi:pimeloyl-ACP methyl ester carboxylesterase
MAAFSADGVTIHYDVSGTAARHLILVHAYPVHSAVWSPQVAALSNDRTVVTYDVRGFGLSAAPDDPAQYSQDRSVADLLALVDHLGLQQAESCGLSMGGNIALNFALRHPDRVSSLVVSGTGSGSDDQKPFIERTNSWAETAERRGMEAFADLVMLDRVFSEYADRGARERAHLRTLILANTVSGVAHTAREVIAKRPTIPQLEPRLKKLPVRTLIVAGALDLAVALASEVMAKAIPSVRLEIVPDTGHFNNLEVPDAVNRLLQDFLLI